MHYHMEIVMPPTSDVEAAVAQVMAPFREGNDDEGSSSFQFWDWFQLGGRYSGSKLEALVSSDQREAFFAEVMLHKSIWNGVSHQDTTFNGSVVEALESHGDFVSKLNEGDYRESITVKPDWLVVTVDYHS